MAKKTLKMDCKVGLISFHDFASVRFTICIITFAVLIFFSWNFQNQCQTKFLPYSIFGIFAFGLAKNLAAKFQNFPGKLWNWTPIKFVVCNNYNFKTYISTFIGLWQCTAAMTGCFKSRLEFSQTRIWDNNSILKNIITLAKIFGLLSIKLMPWINPNTQ